VRALCPCFACICGCSGSADPAASAAGAVSCTPLEPVTTSVALSVSGVLAAGRSADGTLYVLSTVAGALELFVSEGETLIERPEVATGEVNDGDTHTVLFDYTDEAGAPVSVQLRQEASGSRMAVLHGTSTAKLWDIDSEGEELTLIDAQTAIALPATNTRHFLVDYEGAQANGDLLVVIAPEQAESYPEFRFFWGAPARLSERKIQSLLRARSLDGATNVTFAVDTGSAVLRYSFPYPLLAGATSMAALTIGNESESLIGAAPPVLPDGAQFLCR
jgi:hypothetical protein